VASAGDVGISAETLADGGTVVRVDGELDMATTHALEEAVEGADRSRRLVIDLTACTFLDSSAVRVLVSTARAAQTAGGSCSLVASNSGIVRVLEIAAVDTILPVHSTLDSAL
jgi:anti-sigma B factor antagonist